tara:strand:+ start:24 stop:419 length:396 start_codon:yes stop_codon:yes gene_type:complete
MSHSNSPTYFTISSVCEYDGSTTVLAICEDMDAVMYRMKQCYTTCGDEYRINCYHLTTADEAAKKYNEQLVNRRKYEREEREKEAKLKEYEGFEKMMNYDPDKELEEEIEDWKYGKKELNEDLCDEDGRPL